jgi:transmembrane protein EpsG
MILYSGLRNNVGDTIDYVHTYGLIEESGAVMPVWGQKAYLFELIQYLFIKSGAEYTSFIMMSAIVTIIPFILVFYNYSVDYSLAIYLFFTMGIYVSTMNGIRQYIATGIILLGTKYLFTPKRSDFWKLLILILVASLIHDSALIMIPIYFLCRRKAWSAPAFISLSVGVVGLILISMFLPSFLTILENTNYSGYADGWFTDGQETGTSFIRVFFNCMPTIFAAIFSKQIRRFGPIADILINISLVHSAIYILASYNWIFARFAFYTYAYVVLLMAMVFIAALRSGKYRFFAIVLFIAYAIFFIIDARSQRMNWYKSDFFTPNNNMWFKFLYLN